MTHRTQALSAIAALVLASCGGSSGKGGARRSGEASSSHRLHACTPAPIDRGPPPAWTRAAWAGSSPGPTTPYVLASGEAAAGFLFAQRLRAGNPTNPANKVLWVVRFPRNRHPLKITARFGEDRSLVVSSQWPADSAPGQIYPAYVNLPRPGCWSLTLAWGAHRATVDLPVVSRTRRS